jgi:30S ribosomal protein 3
LFWPRKYAWEEIKNELARKPWISFEVSVVLKNNTTDKIFINHWQEGEKNFFD